MLRKAREQRDRQEQRAAGASSGDHPSAPPWSPSASAPGAQQLLQSNAELREENDQLRAAVASMREALERVTGGSSDAKAPSSADSDSDDPQQPPLLSDTNGRIPAIPSSQSRSSPVRTPSSSPAAPHGRSNSEDDGYFGGYSTRRIHELMLRDRTRTLAYQRFIYSSAHLFVDKVVLDVGCGTGILSLFCAKAGARLVIGVDAADIADAAREIVKANGYAERVVIIKGRMEDVVLPVERVDVIVSEWMGYFLLYESMLPSVLFARDRYLAPPPAGQARVYPDAALMYIAAMHDRRHRADALQYWHDVYGFDFSSLIQDSDRYTGSSVEAVQADDLVTSPALLKRIDVQTVKPVELDFHAAFTLPMTADDSVDAFVVWFDAAFDSGAEAEGRVLLSTAPGEPSTHWMQTVFRLHEKVALSKGERVDGELTARRMEKYARAYRVGISYWKVDSAQQAGPRFVQEYTIE